MPNGTVQVYLIGLWYRYTSFKCASAFMERVVVFSSPSLATATTALCNNIAFLSSFDNFIIFLFYRVCICYISVKKYMAFCHSFFRRTLLRPTVTPNNIFGVSLFGKLTHDLCEKVIFTVIMFDKQSIYEYNVNISEHRICY